MKAPLLFGSALSLLALTGCDKKATSSGSSPAPESSVQTRRQQEVPQATAPASKLTGWDELPKPMQKSLENIHRGASKVPTMLKAWAELWNGHFDQPVEDVSPEATEGKGIAKGADSLKSQVPDSVMALLQKGGSLEGFDRAQLVGICATYGGWAYNSEANGQLYYLLQKRANSLPQTEGDLLIAILTDEVVKMIEPPSGIEADQLEGWKKLSVGKNPVYRQAALKIFPRLTRDDAMRAEFLSGFFSETDPSTKQEALKRISSLSAESRVVLLTQFQQAQANLGDQQFAETIQRAIDQNP